MKKFFVLLLTITLFAVGCGRVTETRQADAQFAVTPKTEPIENIGKPFTHDDCKITASEDMKRCIESGGEYALIFNDFDEKYISYCDVPEKRLWRMEITSKND